MKKLDYSLIERVLHWLIALVMIVILLTVFLRVNWLNKHVVGEIIRTKLLDQDIRITEMEGVQVAKAIRQPMWDWHIYMGYVLTGLYALRLILFAKKNRLFEILLSRKENLYSKAKVWMYMGFYVCLGITLVTGLFLVWGSCTFKHSLENIREVAIYWSLLFMVLHIGGLLIACFNKEKSCKLND